jgi:hypothetical protein
MASLKLILNHAVQREVILHALKVGSPPDWDNVPEEFQADLVALDRMEDEALWKIAQSRKTARETTRYEELPNAQYCSDKTDPP